MKYWGKFGGQFVAEVLAPALRELEEAFFSFKKNKEYQKVLRYYLKEYAGRETPLYYAENLSRKWGVKVYLKREDLLHTGAHKINNTLGQILLAKYMGKKRIIAETGAGQHGVATATVCALLKMPLRVYMGEEDVKRQSLNVFRMKLLGAEVYPVGGEGGTLRDAINEALRDWAENLSTTYYLLGSVVGPYPYPDIVRHFQSVIGKEAKRQFFKKERGLPDAIFACVGGGSNAIGIFSAFLKDPVELYGVEGGGRGRKKGEHAASLSYGSVGILHGARTYVLQDEEGMILPVHSISAGLDYPAVGPEHAYLKETGRVKYVAVSDKEALSSFEELAKEEGILPALESSHALAYAKKWAKKHPNGKIIVNLSGRGDKDVEIVQKWYS